MNCAKAVHLEPLYGSGDLDAKTMVEIDLHLKFCDSCALKWEERERFDTLLREAVLAEDVEATAVIERARKEMQSSLRRPIKVKCAAALVAAAGLMIGVVGLHTSLRRLRVEPALYADAAEDHTAEVVDHAPREWVSGNVPIEQMLQQRLAVPGLIRALAPQGYRVDRAMVCPLANRQYVHLVYSNGAREISFFVGHKNGEQVPGTVVEHVNGIAVRAGRAKGLEVAGFQSSQLTILVVSDAPRGEMVRFAAHAASGM